MINPHLVVDPTDVVVVGVVTVFVVEAIVEVVVVVAVLVVVVAVVVIAGVVVVLVVVTGAAKDCTANTVKWSTFTVIVPVTELTMPLSSTHALVAAFQ